MYLGMDTQTKIKLSPAQSRMLAKIKATGSDGIHLPWAQRKTIGSLLKMRLIRSIKIGEGNYRIHIVE